MYSEHHKINKALPVKFIVAITFSDRAALTKSIDFLEKEIAIVDNQSPVFKFNHTTYYEKEMGKSLEKQFLSFSKIDVIEKLVDIKYLAMEIEEKHAIREKRVVNIDPSYLEQSKLVVASTKNFSHRVYIGRGIYGDVQLQYRHKNFISFEWTYPDYKSDLVLNFLLDTRQIYSQQLTNVT